MVILRMDQVDYDGVDLLRDCNVKRAQVKDGGVFVYELTRDIPAGAICGNDQARVNQWRNKLKAGDFVSGEFMYETRDNGYLLQCVDQLLVLCGGRNETKACRRKDFIGVWIKWAGLKPVEICTTLKAFRIDANIGHRVQPSRKQTLRKGEGCIFERGQVISSRVMVFNPREGCMYAGVRLDDDSELVWVFTIAEDCNWCALETPVYRIEDNKNKIYKVVNQVGLGLRRIPDYNGSYKMEKTVECGEYVKAHAFVKGQYGDTFVYVSYGHYQGWLFVTREGHVTMKKIESEPETYSRSAPGYNIQLVYNDPENYVFLGDCKYINGNGKLVRNQAVGYSVTTRVADLICDAHAKDQRISVVAISRDNCSWIVKREPFINGRQMRSNCWWKGYFNSEEEMFCDLESAILGDTEDEYFISTSSYRWWSFPDTNMSLKNMITNRSPRSVALETVGDGYAAVFEGGVVRTAHLSNEYFAEELRRGIVVGAFLGTDGSWIVLREHGYDLSKGVPERLKTRISDFYSTYPESSSLGVSNLQAYRTALARPNMVLW
eukprot:Nk52_evm33s153 gene=Nk52_evmTU33s153